MHFILVCQRRSAYGGAQTQVRFGTNEVHFRQADNAEVAKLIDPFASKNKGVVFPFANAKTSDIKVVNHGISRGGSFKYLPSFTVALL